MAANHNGMSFVSYHDFLMHMMRTNPELRKTAKGMFKQVAWGAAGTIAGAVVRGPFGAMVGAIIGYVIGYILSDDYQSLINALQGLSVEDKAELVKQVQELVGSVSVDALERFIDVPAQRSALLDLLRFAASEFAKGS